jgi:putative intracellular protease/amidase
VTRDEVVTDGRIVTAVGPEAAKKFGAKLVDVLSSQG